MKPVKKLTPESKQGKAKLLKKIKTLQGMVDERQEDVDNLEKAQDELYKAIDDAYDALGGLETNLEISKKQYENKFGPLP